MGVVGKGVGTAEGWDRRVGEVCGMEDMGGCEGSDKVSMS